MYPEADTPLIFPVGRVIFLSEEDLIEEGDLVRKIDYPGYSDYVDYGYIRDMNWRRVGKAYGETLGAWIGAKRGKLPVLCEVIRPVK